MAGRAVVVEVELLVIGVLDAVVILDVAGVAVGRSVCKMAVHVALSAIHLSVRSG